jgi:AcrR family transcriptional regulator
LSTVAPEEEAMPTRRFENLDDELKARLMEVAAEEFSLNGFKEASLNQIIERVGISKGSIYYYFEDKEDLYVATLHHALSEMEDEIRQIASMEPGEDFWADVHEAVRRMTELSARNPRLISLFKAGLPILTSEQAQKRSDIGHIFEGMKAFLSRWMERGKQLGAVRDDLPEDLMGSLLFGVGECLDRWMLTHVEDFSDEAVSELPSLYADVFRRIGAPAAILAREPSFGDR